jgi:hypothetical protein
LRRCAVQYTRRRIADTARRDGRSSREKLHTVCGSLIATGGKMLRRDP